MKITEIIVSAGRVVPHPFESYSNFKPNLTLKATLDDEENLESAVKDLQAKAEKLVEDHKNNLVESVGRLREMEEERAELQNLEEQMKRAQERMETLRSGRRVQLPVESGTYHVAKDEEMPF